MKSKVIVMKNVKIKIILFISITFFIFFLANGNNTEKTNNQPQVYNEYESEEKQVIQVTASKPKQAYLNMPEQINGFKVIGKIEIPKIELQTYILEETTKESLNESVTKLCGPKINGVGNFCILGHNYNSETMFKKLKNLELNDKILITDIYNQTTEYAVYDIYKVYPKETECLSQETEGEKEITLITCTTGAIKRLIVKAREIYD